MNSGFRCLQFMKVISSHISLNLQNFPLGHGMQDLTCEAPRVGVHLPFGQGVVASADPSSQYAN